MSIVILFLFCFVFFFKITVLRQLKDTICFMYYFSEMFMSKTNQTEGTCKKVSFCPTEQKGDVDILVTEHRTATTHRIFKSQKCLWATYLGMRSTDVWSAAAAVRSALAIYMYKWREGQNIFFQPVLLLHKDHHINQIHMVTFPKEG